MVSTTSSMGVLPLMRWLAIVTLSASGHVTKGVGGTGRYP